MKYYTILILLLSINILNSAELKLDNWIEIPTTGSNSDPVSTSYSKTQTIGGLQIRSLLTHVVSTSRNTENIIQEVEVKYLTDSDDKLVPVARLVTIGGNDNGFWMFLNSFSEKFEIYGGVADKDGVYFAKSNERFVVITPKEKREGSEFWVVVFIADHQGVYNLYNNSDSNKYNGKIKK